MKTREQHLEEQIERMDMSREQYSKELNIVADVVKERDKLRTELECVSKGAAEMRDALRRCGQWAHELIAYDRDFAERNGVDPIVIKCALSMDAGRDYVKLQSLPEPPASTSGTAAPVEAGPAHGASDLPACDNKDITQPSPTTVPDTGACKSGGESPATAAYDDTVRSDRDTDRLLYGEWPATPPTGGMPDNGGA